MLKNFVNFAADEDGAVTVDWVVLTAGVVSLSLVIGATIPSAVNTKSTEIAATVASANTATP
jgi:Flp pilus assembly pilin Flp